jgi:hypothetical protein
MKSITSAFARHIGYVKRYPLTVLLLTLCCCIILYTSYVDKNLKHALGYILGAWFCCLLTDIVINVMPKEIKDYPIKKPVKKELLTIIVCTILGAAFLVIRFFTDWQQLSGYLKLSALPLLLFTFPIILAIIYLFRYKYEPKELGLNLNYWELYT